MAPKRIGCEPLTVTRKPEAPETATALRQETDMASSHATKSKQSLGRTSLLDLIHECSCMNYLLTHLSPLPPFME
jgi:hypothetical protein